LLTVEVSLPTIAVLRAHRQRQLEQRLRAGELWADLDLVFSTDDGKPYDGGFISRTFKKIATDAALQGPRFHDLRHSSVTLLLKSGEPMANVSRRTGHSTIGVTVDTYGHQLGARGSMAATMGEIIGNSIANPDRWLAKTNLGRRAKRDDC